MILAIDVGNTHIVLGGFDRDTIRFTSRLATDRLKTGDEYAVLIDNA
ncbi:MAG: pantothenate kinase, partial [Oscillospiraceae bacterium]